MPVSPVGLVMWLTSHLIGHNRELILYIRLVVRRNGCSVGVSMFWGTGDLDSFLQGVWTRYLHASVRGPFGVLLRYSGGTSVVCRLR